MCTNDVTIVPKSDLLTIYKHRLTLFHIAITLMGDGNYATAVLSGGGCRTAASVGGGNLCDEGYAGQFRSARKVSFPETSPSCGVITNPLPALRRKFNLRHYQKPPRAIDAKSHRALRPNLQPEARQLALLEVVVNKKANPDSQRNDPHRRSCQHIALLHDIGSAR